MAKILVLSRGVVARDMASTGIRAYHMARVLAEQLPEAQVTLAVPNEPDIPPPHSRVRLVRYESQWGSVREMRDHDIIISRNFPPHVISIFAQKLFVLDSFTALFIEWMELSKRKAFRKGRKSWMAANQRYLNLQFTLADYIICSNERQRDVWVGALSALGLITPEVYDRDSTLYDLIGVVPYGVPPGRPEHTKQVLKGVVPGIRETDTVLIWNGLLVEWFDAETVIQAMAEVSRTRADVKLFFLGTQHPEWVTGTEAPPVRRAIELSKQLSLYNRSVFFNVGWVPYREIGNYLNEADMGICTGFDNLEARYSFRTRFVDLIWAELPIVCTRGDVLADRIEREPLGVAVPPEDAQALAAGILRLAGDKDFYQHCRSNLRTVKEEMRWERAMAPLVEFCRGGKAIAASKRQRLLPLLQHSALYLLGKTLTRVAQRGEPGPFETASLG